jgi:outer membrane protein OmpA-like peptidoglycan-associated protein
MTTSFTKMQVCALGSVLLVLAACQPAASVPPRMSVATTEVRVASVFNDEPARQPLPVPAPPSAKPQARLAMRDAIDRDVAKDFAPVFTETERPLRQGERDARTNTSLESSAARAAKDAAATPSYPDWASSQHRGALEALDRLAFNVPVLEDERGKFVRLSVDDLFEPGEATFATLAMLDLDNIARALKKQRDRIILVQAYTDSLGSNEEAQELSLRRAKAICRYMIQRGVPARRLKPQGSGAANPIAENSTPEGRSRNRRIEIVITVDQI